MRERLQPIGVLAALLVGLSPSLLAAVEQIVRDPRLCYVAAELVLLVLITRRHPKDSAARLANAVPWVLAAVVIQLLAAAGGFPRLSRFAVPFGMVAYLRGVRGTPLPVALMSFLCMPVPHVVTELLGIDFAVFWSQLAQRIAPAYMGDLLPLDGGTRLMAVAMGVIGYRALRTGTDLRGAVLALACAFVIAIPLQILAFVLAGFAGESLSRFIFIHGSWMIAFTVDLFVPWPGLERDTWPAVANAHAH